MILLPDEQKQLFNFVVDDLLKERGSAIYLTDALAYAERAVVSALLSGRSEIKLDLGHVRSSERSQSPLQRVRSGFHLRPWNRSD